MNKELALKLKDGGFPQGITDGSWLWDENGRFKMKNSYGAIQPQKWTVCPTLSELIEACNEGVFMLSQNSKGQWFAEKGMLLETITEEGSTPEEAVANLWLELNKK